MPDTTLSTYETADWWSRLAGVVHARHDTGGTLFVNEVLVETIDRRGHFTVLRCVDGSTRVVLTSFLRLVPGARGHEGHVDAAATHSG